jgi:predicted DNA-binding transcriptional regulator AlpA
MEKQYYKPEEVMKLLNKSRSTFYREVEDGTIPSELEEGRKRGRKFPKEAIDAMVDIEKKKGRNKRGPDIIQMAKNAAIEAGNYLVEHLGHAQIEHQKSPKDYLLDADLEAERLILAKLRTDSHPQKAGLLS